MSQKRCYSELTHPSMRDSIRQHNCYALQLAMLVAEFAQQVATAYENFSKELETVIGTFRKSSNDLKKDRPSDTPSSIFAAWETLLQETENDAQAHLDVAGLLIKNVYKPLEEIATHKTSQAHKLYQFRDVFEDLIKRSEEHLLELENEYHNSFKRYSNIMSTSGRETAKSDFYNAHNDYVLQFRASNCLVEKVQDVLPAVLEELEEIHIDTCNTIKVAIESHALVLLTKATERHRRFDDLLKVCHQVNPQLDISYFIRSMSQEAIRLELTPYEFNSPANINAEVMEHESVRDQLIIDRHTESTIRTRRQAVQKEAAELTSYIKQNQDVTQSLVNMCQRSSDSDKSFDKSPSASFDQSPDSPQRKMSRRKSLTRSPSISSSFKLFRSFSREQSFDNEPGDTSSYRRMRSDSGKFSDVDVQEHHLQRRISKLSLDRQSHASHQSGHYADVHHGGHPISPNIDPHDFSRGNVLPYGHHSTHHSGRHHHHHHHMRRRLMTSLSTDESHRDVSDDHHHRSLPGLKKGHSFSDHTAFDLRGHQAQIDKRLRNLANHLYAKVYETQEDMCRKRNEIRLANIQLAAVRAQIEVLSPNHNGAVESADQEPKKTHSSASIKGMWKKAVKSLKSNSGEPKPTRLSKKGSLIKRKDSKEGSEGEGAEEAQEIDPVYSLLKCAADLPKASRSCTHSHCSGHHARHSVQGDSACGNTSKNSSPSSSEVPASKQKEKPAKKKEEEK